MTKQLCPHNHYARSMMTHPKVSKEFFRGYLPTHIQEIIDFQSIKLTSKSFIDEELKLQIADLLFSATFNGKSGFLYVLFEHASQSTPLLPFRMHKYTVSVMDKP